MLKNIKSKYILKMIHYYNLNFLLIDIYYFYIKININKFILFDLFGKSKGLLISHKNKYLNTIKTILLFF